MKRIILIGLIFLIWGCRKADLELDQKGRLPNKLSLNEQRFFEVTSITLPVVVEIVNQLKKENERSHFIERLIQTDGYALWDKAITESYYLNEDEVLKSTNNISGITKSEMVISESDTLIYIPIVPEGRSNVYSFIAAQKSKKGISYKIYSGRDYKKYGYGSLRSSIISAEKIASLTMLLDYNTFGYTTFLITDKNLFKKSGKKNGHIKKVTLKVNNTITSSTRSTQPISPTLYMQYSYCFSWEEFYCPYIVSSGTCGAQTICDYVLNNYCSTGECGQTTSSECFVKLIYLSGSGGGTVENPPSGGGGDGSGNTADDPCPVNSPCGNLGWTALKTLTIDLKGALGLSQQSWFSDWVSDNPERALDIRDYLTKSTNINKVAYAKRHVILMHSDPAYAEFVQKHVSAGGWGKMWWDDYNFLTKYGGLNFGEWAINYLWQTSDVSFSTFENWFFTLSKFTLGEPQIDPDLITYDQQITQSSLPTLNDFLTYFPKSGTSGSYREEKAAEVYRLVGGSLYTNHLNGNPAYQNACAIRGSRALLYSGITIPVLLYGSSQRTEKGSDNKNYILDAISFNKFMIDKFGDTPYKLTGSDANDPQKIAALLKGKNGIYVIINNNGSASGAGYSGHVDLILNGSCISGAYTRPKDGVKSIRIWVLN